MIDRFGLDEPSIVMSPEELWSKIQAAFLKIVPTLTLESAVLFHSNNRDPFQMELRACYSPRKTLPETFSLSSYQEFEWLEIEGWVEVPQETGYFSWLDPKSLLGVEHGVLFGREIVGQLIVIGVGVDNVYLHSASRRPLRDTVASIFRFLNAGLTAAALDFLMAETGHLMGRAIGKVIAGVEGLKETLVVPPPDTYDGKLFRLSLWAIEDGEVRLELVRQNFYSFQARRRQVSDLDKLFDLHAESFDALKEVQELKRYFNTLVANSDLKPIHWDLGIEAPVLIRGNREAFKLILLNLFDNAVKFSYRNTYIVIKIESAEARCEISVTNLGVGVAKDEFISVFQPLARSRYHDPSRRVEGLGLGLSYCKRTIEEVFGGVIKLVSRKVGEAYRSRFEGDNWITTVTVVLPIDLKGGADASQNDSIF